MGTLSPTNELQSIEEKRKNIQAYVDATKPTVVSAKVPSAVDLAEQDIRQKRALRKVRPMTDKEMSTKYQNITRGLSRPSGRK
jgi:hypothetical protein